MVAVVGRIKKRRGLAVGDKREETGFALAPVNAVARAGEVHAGFFRVRPEPVVQQAEPVIGRSGRVEEHARLDSVEWKDIVVSTAVVIRQTKVGARPVPAIPARGEAEVFVLFAVIATLVEHRDALVLDHGAVEDEPEGLPIPFPA